MTSNRCEHVRNLLMIIRLALAFGCKVTDLRRLLDRADLRSMLPESEDRTKTRRKRGSIHEPNLHFELVERTHRSVGPSHRSLELSRRSFESSHRSFELRHRCLERDR